MVSEQFNTVVIGAGQAGLSVGYHLKQRGIPFIILEAHRRIGDSWRTRWDSLRLFTPARFNSLDGMNFPGPSSGFPTKDEMGDYLEQYARRFGLPVRTGMRVESVRRSNGHFDVSAGGRTLEAQNIVVAMANYQKPSVPAFASELDPDIVQIHSFEYRSPSQLKEGSVLIVGAGNSGAEIAMEVARTHTTWMSGRDVGHLPFRVSGALGRLILVRLVLRGLFHRLLTIGTPVGRKVRPKVVSQGGPLIRQRPKELAAAGIVRVPRVAGVRGGKPLLEDQRVLDVQNVIWCTGFRPGFSWIEGVDQNAKEPAHRRGVVASIPGLYFVGLHFLYSLSSAMVHGVGRDARFVAETIARHQVLS